MASSTVCGLPWQWVTESMVGESYGLGCTGKHAPQSVRRRVSKFAVGLVVRLLL